MGDDLREREMIDFGWLEGDICNVLAENYLLK